MRNIMVLVLTVAACSSGGDGAEAPSCQQAVGHYYAAGCALFRTDGSQYPELEVIENCKELLGTAPPSCVDDLEDLRICFGTVPSPAMGNADCDCSAEQDALFTCE